MKLALLLTPYIPVCYVKTVRRSRQERLWRLNMGFGDAIRAMSSALEAGYSAENAVSEAAADLKLSMDEEEPIMKELRIMENKLRNSVPMEEAVRDLAARSGLEDIRSFATVFGTAKRSGGNLVSIIGSTAGVIRTRVELKREMRMAVAGRRYELNIMKLMPPVILAYLRVCMPEVVEGLYSDVFGSLFMTVILVIYVVAVAVAEQMSRIEL